MDNYNFTKGKWKHKKGKRAKFEYDNFIIDEYGNHIVKWSNTGNGSHKLTIKESHANALLISKAPEMLEILNRIHYDISNRGCLNNVGLNDIEQLIKEATEI